MGLKEDHIFLSDSDCIFMFSFIHSKLKKNKELIFCDGLGSKVRWYLLQIALGRICFFHGFLQSMNENLRILNMSVLLKKKIKTFQSFIFLTKCNIKLLSKD